MPGPRVIESVHVHVQYKIVVWGWNGKAVCVCVYACTEKVTAWDGAVCDSTCKSFQHGVAVAVCVCEREHACTCVRNYVQCELEQCVMENMHIHIKNCSVVWSERQCIHVCV